MTHTTITTIPHRTAESADFDRPRSDADTARFNAALARAAAQSPHVRAVIDAPSAESTSVVTDAGNEAVDRVHERLAQDGSLTPIAQQAQQQLGEAAGRTPAAEHAKPNAQPAPTPHQQQAQPAPQPTARTDQPAQSTTAAPQQATAPAAEPTQAQGTNQGAAAPGSADQPAAAPARQPSNNPQQQQQQHGSQARPAAITAGKATAQPSASQPQSAFASTLRQAAQMSRSRVQTAQNTPYKFDQAKLEAQAARGLAAALKQRGGVVNMKLNPASLGTLKVRVEIRNGTVDAKFETSTPQARELLESNLNSLRAALESRGLTVEKLSIAEQPAQDAPSGGVGDDRGSEDHQAGDRPNAGHQGAGRAANGSHATDGEPIPDDPALVALGERAQSTVGGAGITIRLDTVV